jgi:hypothetical protein
LSILIGDNDTEALLPAASRHEPDAEPDADSPLTVSSSSSAVAATPDMASEQT